MQSKISFLLPFILIILSITYFLSGEDGHKSKKNKKKYRSLQSESNILRSDTISTNFMELGLVDEELFSLEEISKFLQLLQREETENLHTHSGIHSITSRIENYCRQLVNNYDKNNFQEYFLHSCIEELAKVAFPLKYADISSYYKSLLKYRAWLESSQSIENKRKGMEWEISLWQKRYEIFGMEASEELYAGERYLKKIQSQIDLSSGSDKNIDVKIDLLKENINNLVSLKQNPQDSLGEEFVQYGEMFLSSTKVQENLWELQPERRYETLKKIRTSVGIPENRLEDLDRWDRQRISEWEKGQLYLKELNELKKNIGSNREKFNQESEKLKVLILGTENASEIIEEEKQGINRFAQKPVFLLQ